MTRIFGFEFSFHFNFHTSKIFETLQPAVQEMAAMTETQKPLRFQPLSSSIHISFWQELSRRKLEVFRLSKDPVPVRGNVCVASDPRLPGQIEVSSESFMPGRLSPASSSSSDFLTKRIASTTISPNDLEKPRESNDSEPEKVVLAPAQEGTLGTSSTGSFSVPGELHIMNTREEFKRVDKRELLASAARRMWSSCTDAPSSNLRELCRFIVLIHADLKKHKFLYWFGFPAIQLVNIMPPPVSLKPPCVANEEETAEIDRAISSYLSISDRQSIGDLQPAFVLARCEVQSDGIFKCYSVQQWATKAISSKVAEEDDASSISICFFDSSPLSEHPGWPLRNILTYLRRHGDSFRIRDGHVSIISLRLDPRRRDRPYVAVKFSVNTSLEPSIKPSKETFIAVRDNEISAVGWETDRKGRPRPRQADLQSSMDPRKLARVSVDLNVKLMRWRMLPDLDTKRLASTRCLLLGAGTLGCNVARCLLGWGVRHITLVDNGSVSYSNPVRQSLFRFDDCANGGKPKAAAAAEELKRIFPDVQSTGVKLNIPMPGHVVDIEGPRRDAVQNDVRRLEEMITGHDVTFLLTDTRESRWLPTMLGAFHDKLVINCALGFDSFLVMRHGIHQSDAKGQHLKESPSGEHKSEKGAPPEYPRLGCYFCNDIVAPANSTRDRTLDQQCTVTRPGLALMASAIGVELLVGLLHHPQGSRAPADESKPVFQACEHRLGLLPHQIRGYLTHFSNVIAHGPAFQQCTACSDVILGQYSKDGFAFLHRVFNNPTHLEDISGITAMNKVAEDLSMDDFAFSDDEGDLM